jgi:hypothetical protein
MKQGWINWTPKKREQFRKRHDWAVTNKRDQFTFEEHVFYTPYAGHLLEYLDHMLKKHPTVYVTQPMEPGNADE